jgi:hypothetical protein
VVHDYLELVVHERLEVEIADLHDDLKSDEMHDAVLNGVLQGEHVKIDGLCGESHYDLY